MWKSGANHLPKYMKTLMRWNNSNFIHSKVACDFIACEKKWLIKNHIGLKHLFILSLTFLFLFFLQSQLGVLFPSFIFFYQHLWVVLPDLQISYSQFILFTYKDLMVTNFIILYLNRFHFIIIFYSFFSFECLYVYNRTV